MAAILRGDIIADSDRHAHFFKKIAERYTPPSDKTDSEQLDKLYGTIDNYFRLDLGTNIDMAFLWSSTSEKHEFWEAFHNAALDANYLIPDELRLYIIRTALTKPTRMNSNRLSKQTILELQKLLLNSLKPIRTTYPLIKLYYIRLANYNHRYFPLGGQYGLDHTNTAID